MKVFILSLRLWWCILCAIKLLAAAARIEERFFFTSRFQKVLFLFIHSVYSVQLSLVSVENWITIFFAASILMLVARLVPALDSPTLLCIKIANCEETFRLRMKKISFNLFQQFVVRCKARLWHLSEKTTICQLQAQVPMKFSSSHRRNLYQDFLLNSSQLISL